jgi:hypothetical protein
MSNVFLLLPQNHKKVDEKVINPDIVSHTPVYECPESSNAI